MSAPAGWYPDPERSGASRWWDGESWAPSGVDRSGVDPSDLGTSRSSDAQGIWEANDFTPSWEASPVQPSWELDAQQTVAAETPAPSWDRAQDVPTPETEASTQQSEGTWTSSERAWTPSSSSPSTGGAGRAGIVASVVGGGGVLTAIAIAVVTGLAGSNGAQPVDNPTAPITSFPTTVALSIPEDGEATQRLEIGEAGSYTIAVESTNGEDPVLTLDGEGESWSDDDDGGYPDSLLTTALVPGTYELGVTEFGGDALTVDVTVTQEAVSEPLEPITDVPATVELDIPAGLQAVQPLTISEAGTYTIEASATNGEDPTLAVTEPDGAVTTDDDGGGGLDALLTLELEPGEHTIVVEELSGDPLTATLVVTRA